MDHRNPFRVFEMLVITEDFIDVSETVSCVY
jgi:hypothetical protein